MAPKWRPSKLEMWNVSSNINTYGTVWINLSPKWDYLKWQKSLELDKIFLWKLFNLLSISKNSQIHRQCHEDNTWLWQPTRPFMDISIRSQRTWQPGRFERVNWPCYKQLILFRLQHFWCNYWIMKSLWIVFAREYS